MKAAQTCIDQNGTDFDEITDQIGRRNFSILWKQDWYVVKLFERRIEDPSEYTDLAQFEELKASGRNMIAEDSLGQLRSVINSLYRLRKKQQDINHEEMFEDVNVVRGE